MKDHPDLLANPVNVGFGPVDVDAVEVDLASHRGDLIVHPVQAPQ